MSNCSVNISGTNTHTCAGKSQAQCDADVCCVWQAGKPAVCAVRTCAQVAAVDNNPDLCEGCNTCGGIWDVTDARATLPWNIDVQTYVRIASGGSLKIPSGKQVRIT